MFNYENAEAFSAEYEELLALCEELAQEEENAEG